MRKLFWMLTVCTVLLMGCSDGEELSKGKTLYSNKQYKDAYEHFAKLNKENPSKKNKEWMAKASDKYYDSTLEKINKAFENQEWNEVETLINTAIELKPNEEKLQKSQKQIIKIINDQSNFDNYTDFLNWMKKDLDRYSDEWNEMLNQYESKKVPAKSVIDLAKRIHPKITELRSEAEDIGYVLTSDQLKESNTSTFTYLWQIEKGLTVVPRLSVEEFYTVRQRTERLSPDVKKENMDRISKTIDSYVNEENVEGEKLRNLKNTLNF